jgi:anti-anti-sigma factor
LVVVALCYGIAAFLSLQFALVGEVVTPIWPPTGIAVVALLLLGRRVWPGVALAAFVVNLFVAPSVAAAAIIAVGNTLAPLLAAELLRREGFDLGIDRFRDAVLIVAVGVGAMTVSATVGTGALFLTGAIGAGALLETWTVWWAGDATGVLLFAPLLLAFRRSAVPRLPRRWVEAAFLGLGLLCVSAAAFSVNPPLRFLAFPFLVWAAVRFGLRGASMAAVVVAMFAVRGVIEGLGSTRAGLAGQMLGLQAFNAAAALTSLTLAAAVGERARGTRALERARTDLEQRVDERTADLVEANRRMASEVQARQAAQEEAERRERQLAAAERVAQTGSWDWDIRAQRVWWSDEMYRIYGHEPQSFPIDFGGGEMRQTSPGDQERMRADLRRRLENPTVDHPPLEYRIVRPDGEERLLLGRGRVVLGDDGTPVQMLGTIQDITETRRAEEAVRERAEAERALRQQQEIAHTLQSSLLPEGLPDVPGMTIAARYLPGSAGLEVGGDWYDVFPLPGGAVALSIGDIVGRGLRAAAAMGQLRTALRAYALDEAAPGATLDRLGNLARTLPEAEMATLIYGVFQPDAGVLSFVCAGHPPPLLVRMDGSSAFLEEGRSAPLGVTGHPAVETMVALEPGSILLLYTDGLVERRDHPLDEGLALLAQAAADAAGCAPEEVCDAVMAAMVGDGTPQDDVALMVLAMAPGRTEQFRFAAAAEPQHVAPLRRALFRWLSESGASQDESDDIVLAVSEAAANAVLHAYGPEDGTFEVVATVEDREFTATVTDAGRWRSRGPDQGGRGLRLIQALVDSAEIESGQSGTKVRLRRRLGQAPLLKRAGMADLTGRPPTLKTRPGPGDGIVVVRLEQGMDISTAEPMGAELARAISSEDLGLVVDLSGVTHLDSSGIRLLFRLGRRLERRRQQLRVVAPVGSAVRRVLDIAGVWAGDYVAQTVEDAVDSIRRYPAP